MVGLWEDTCKQGDEDEAEDKMDDEIFSEQQIKEVKEELHKIMDDIMLSNKDRLDKLLSKANTQEFIETWSELVEDAFFKFGNISGKDALQYKGHGQVKIEQREIPYSGEYDPSRGQMKVKSKDKEISRIGM